VPICGSKYFSPGHHGSTSKKRASFLELAAKNYIDAEWTDRAVSA